MGIYLTISGGRQEEELLPNLELMVPVIGSRLCNHLQRNGDITQIYVRSDNQIVL